jgi:hypothetical protein
MTAPVCAGCPLVRYTDVEMMDGENQYKAEGHGLQVRDWCGGGAAAEEGGREAEHPYVLMWNAF